MTDFFFMELFTILPYLAFYLLSKPRDLFKELDKNPIRPYSIFQLTASEHLEHQLIAKWGRKKAKIILNPDMNRQTIYNFLLAGMDYDQILNAYQL